MHTLAITFLALLSLRELHSRKRYYTRVIQRSSRVARENQRLEQESRKLRLSASDIECQGCTGLFHRW